MAGTPRFQNDEVTSLQSRGVGKRYNFPTESRDGRILDGAGVCIGIIETGGGFNPEESTSISET